MIIKVYVRIPKKTFSTGVRLFTNTVATKSVMPITEIASQYSAGDPGAMTALTQTQWYSVTRALKSEG